MRSRAATASSVSALPIHLRVIRESASMLRGNNLVPLAEASLSLTQGPGRNYGASVYTRKQLCV